MNKLEKLRRAERAFRSLLESHEKSDADAALMLKWLGPLFNEIESERVTPPRRYEFKVALGMESSFYDPDGPFFKAESDFVCALEDWESQPWYKAIKNR